MAPNREVGLVAKKGEKMAAVTPQRRMQDVSHQRLVFTPKKNENARVNAILTQLDIEGKYYRSRTQYS